MVSTMSSSDQITAVRIYHCIQPMSVSYATDTRNAMDGLVIEVSTTQHPGWGEVLMPRVEPFWSGARQVVPPLIGARASGLDTLLTRWPANRPKMSLAERGTYCHPEVDGVGQAVSIALHDLHARHEGVRFADLVGSIARTEIPGMPAVTLGPIEGMVAEAEDWRALGSRFLKIKRCGNADRDGLIVQKIRQALGPGMNLQVDANGAYETVAAAQPVIAGLNAAEVAVIEDLFQIGNEDAFRLAHKQLSGRTMLDKECYWPHLKHSLSPALVDIINQHPHNQGSMTNALKIAHAAQAAGGENAMGSSGILGIRNTAFLHLAAVTGLTRPGEEYWSARVF